MLNLTSPDGKFYSVTFAHFNPNGNGPNAELAREGGAGTSCFICELDSADRKQVVTSSSGHTTLHENDYSQYDKKKGRKLALARALQVMFPGMEGRTARTFFWKTYLNFKAGTSNGEEKRVSNSFEPAINPPVTSDSEQRAGS